MTTETTTKPAALKVCSTVQIFKLDDPESRVFDGKTITNYHAQCALMNDDGSLHVVGRMRLTEELHKRVQPGFYRFSYGSRVATYGKSKGDIEAMIVDLVPVPTRGKSPNAPAPSVAA